MKSSAPGSGTSAVKVKNISPHGFWLLLGGEELFASFDTFPWFRDAPVAQICNVQRPSPNHLYWPDLDIDLAVDSVREPGKFPLVSKLPA